MPRSALAAALAGLAVALAACGAEQAGPPKTSVSKGDPTHRVRYPQAGISLRVPVVAGIERRRYPGVVKVSVGQAFIAVFAYRRREQVPRSGADLGAARRRLVAQVHRRNLHFRLIRSKPTRVAGARAIQLLGDQTISRARLRTRSLHVFKGDGEYVIDMLAPVAEFRAANRTFFSPAARSVRVSGRVRRG
jgi:hypothetical protein